LFVVSAAVLWGTVGVATQSIYGLAETNPLSIGFFRLAFAAPVLVLACRAVCGPAWHRVERRDFRRMGLIGAMLALYQACFFGAIERVGVAVATLVTLCTAPVIVALLSVVVLRERPNRGVLLALACALAGTALLVDLQGGGRTTQDSLAGVALSLGSAFGYAVVALLSRALAGRYHPLQPIALGFPVGALVLFVLAAPAGLAAAYPPPGWALLLYLGLVPTALGYLLFFTGMRTTSAATASIATLIEPLTAAILAIALFGERLGPSGSIGAVLLVVAMVVLYREGG
jgi:DME family drug/metabolite transporter